MIFLSDLRVSARPETRFPRSVRPLHIRPTHHSPHIALPHHPPTRNPLCHPAPVKLQDQLFDLARAKSEPALGAHALRPVRDPFKDHLLAWLHAAEAFHPEAFALMQVRACVCLKRETKPHPGVCVVCVYLCARACEGHD